MTIQEAIQEYDNFRQRTRQTDSLRLIDNPLLHRIGETADALGLECYVVGGYVRDIILERPSKDIDVLVVGEGGGIRLAGALAKELDRGAHVSIFRNFGTAQLKWHEHEVEFVGARRESYQRDSRKPIVEDGTLDDDLHRRDFTINALAFCLNKDRYGEFIDLFDGLLDLEDGIIATPLDPDITFSDDPLRMMRCIRFATQLRFQIEEETAEALRRNAQRIKIISQERIIDELNKIMMAPVPSIGFIELSRSGLLPIILPEVAALEGVESRNGRAHKDNFYHTLTVLDHVAAKSDNLWLRWAALLHDIGKPATKRYDEKLGWTFHGHEVKGSKMVKKIFSRLRLPLDNKMKYVEKLVLLHLRPIILAEDEVTDSAVRRLLFDAGDDIDDLMTLCEADITSKNEEKVRRYMNNFQIVRQKLVELEEKDRIRNFQPPVSGEDIMKTFGIPPCYDIGVIKDAIKNAILDGIIPNEREAAWQMMLDKGAELGYKPIEQ